MSEQAPEMIPVTEEEIRAQAQRQVEVWKRLAWQSDESAEEEIRALVDSRSGCRDVEDF